MERVDQDITDTIQTVVDTNCIILEVDEVVESFVLSRAINMIGKFLLSEKMKNRIEPLWKSIKNNANYLIQNLIDTLYLKESSVKVHLEFKLNDRILIVGRKNAGKTYLASHMFRRCSHGIVYDSYFTLNSLGYVVHTIGALDEAMNKRNIKKIVFQPDIDTAECFNRVCQMVYERGNLMFYVDNVEEYVFYHSMPPSFASVIENGMVKGIGVIMVTSFIEEIHETFIRKCQHIIAFQMFQVDYLKIFMPRARKAMSLKDRHFLHYDQQKLTICKPI